MSQIGILPFLNIDPIAAFQRADRPVQAGLPAKSYVTTPSGARGTPPMAIKPPAPISRLDYGLGKAAMMTPPTGGLVPLPSTAKDPSMLQRLQADKPFAVGLTAAGQALSEASGYTAQPKDTLSMINQAMAAFNQAQQKRAMFEAQQAMKEKERQQNLALEYAKLGKPSDFMQRVRAAGYDPETPEGQQFIREVLTKSDTVFMGGDKQKEEAYKAALATRKTMQQQVDKDRELGVRLETAIDLLKGGAETGRVSAAMLPLKQLAAEAGLLGDEELQNLTNQEIIDSVASFLVPRMRVVGSGSSSDRDMDFFSKSTIRMANTPEANLLIASMQKQVMDYNKKRLSLFENYVKKQGDDFGFADFADEKMGRLYQKPATDKEFTKLVDDGKIKEGDVFFNADPEVMEFDILTREMM